MHQRKIAFRSRRRAILLMALMLSSLMIWAPSASAADGDGDGYDDAVDDCLFSPGNSTTGKLGCPDTDGDGTPDILQGTVSDFNEADYRRTVTTSSSRSSMVRTIAVAPNGMVLAGADSGDRILVLDAAGNEIKTLLTITSNPRDIDISANGTLVAISAYEADNNASVNVFTMDWVTLNATLLVNLSANHEEDMYALRFNPDGSRLHVGGQDKNVTTYDTSTWAILHQIPSGDDVYTIKTSPDGRFIAFTHGEELGVHWASNGTEYFNRHNNSGYTLGLDWSPDGNWIVTGSSDNRVRIYHAGNGTLLKNMTYSGDVNEIAFNRAGTHLVIATSDNDPTWIVRTSDWTVESTFGDFGGGSGGQSSSRRGARDVAWSQDETKIYFGARYYGRIYTYYSTDAYAWLGGDVTGELMQSRFHEYADNHSDYIPMHFNSTTIQTTAYLCSGTNPKGNAPLIAAASSTAAERSTTPLANYSDSGMRDCDSSGDRLIEVPVARMPASVMVDPNTLTHQCVNSTGGLSMGQIRWILSGASQSTLTQTSETHPGIDWASVVPNDNGNGMAEWRDLDSSCPNEPIHIMHRWENRSVTQMISSYIFCDHCSFPEDWFEADFERLRLIQESRGDIINGAANNEDVIGITELRLALQSNDVYHVPIYDNWTHGASDALSAGNSPILPSITNSSTGIWPFQDDYRLVIREDSLDLLRPFLAWMLSEEGQDNFDEIGFIRMDPLSRVLAGDRIGINMRNILPDDDGDGIWNGDDHCPNTAQSEFPSVDENGCSDSQRDSDGDGYMDSVDDCPNISGTSTIPTLGCSDVDGDGWADTADAFPSESTQWNDTDGDGYGDEITGHQPDACPDDFGTSTVDRFGCLDTDGDGWSNAADAFPSNPSQWADVDQDGVGDNYTWTHLIDDIRQHEMGDAFPLDITQNKDRDGDGYGDNASGFLPDYCPNQPGTSTLGGKLGCPDSDGDGWTDDDDAFPNEPSQHEDSDGDGHGDSLAGVNADVCPDTDSQEVLLVDSLGCGPSERDGDIDGVSDAVDQCPSTPIEYRTQVNSVGCAPTERDTDGDGYVDALDSYPEDPTQNIDSDGDGFPDNSSGTNGDDCPTIYGESTEDRRGCEDTDGDGWSDADEFWSIADGADALFNNPTQWSDSDGDGKFDNYADVAWLSDPMRTEANTNHSTPSWPGQLMPNAKDPDRCPFHAYTFQNVLNPGCPPDIDPSTESTGENQSTPPTYTHSDDGGMSGMMIALIVIGAILLVSIAGGMILLRKPKKKSTRSKDTNRVEAEMAREDISQQSDADEMLEPEDDPNFTVDENGCEWWKDDDGKWWYRTPEMDEWAEHPN
ncbi:MAG: hypothetical protein VX627_04010 [Candidatus Thermoplasmatota archaeon]|nr:hypothetical protein [Candidatus Thermoplasmatota archaeon]